MGNSGSTLNWNPDLPPSLNNGTDVIKQSVTWTIENFNVIRLDRRSINSQTIDFTLGGSKWTGRLAEEPSHGKRWIRITIQPQNGEFLGKSFMFRFEIRSEGGWLLKNDLGSMIFEQTGGKGITKAGYDEFIDADDYFMSFFQKIVIQMSFVVLTPPQPKTKSLGEIMVKFKVQFLDQLRKDLADVLDVPDACLDIKIVSNDKKEFSMKKGILAVRSEVFAAMLRCDMIEANSGVIQLPDISSKALKVLLNFLKSGDLLPEWRETEIIVELTNAAGKYQLRDLLQFLDEAMGKVCQLENVQELYTLARQLSLKAAEKELMQFATFSRNNGRLSLDKFIQIGIEKLPSSDDRSDPEPQVT